MSLAITPVRCRRENGWPLVSTPAGHAFLLFIYDPRMWLSASPFSAGKMACSSLLRQLSSGEIRGVQRENRSVKIYASWKRAANRLRDESHDHPARPSGRHCDLIDQVQRVTCYRIWLAGYDDHKPFSSSRQQLLQAPSAKKHHASRLKRYPFSTYHPSSYNPP